MSGKDFPTPTRDGATPRTRWRVSMQTAAYGIPHAKMVRSITTKRPRLKRYLDEMDGGVMGCVWTDISPINSQAQDRLGYPTQKPLALFGRLVQARSNEGAV